MSNAAPAPLESYRALTGARRPLISTSVLLASRPRILTLAVPEPDGELEASSPWSKMSIDGIELSSSFTLVAPVFSMSFLVMTWTGAGPSTLVRLMAEPVTVTRCIGCSSCCWAHAEVALVTTNTAALIALRLNI